MNRHLAYIPKALALLAVTMLPVEQSLAASCCCRIGHHGRQPVREGAAQTGSENGQHDGGSTAEKRCCRCCEHGHSNSRPCNCPAGCFSHGAPKAVSSVKDRAFLAVDLSITAVNLIATEDVGTKPSCRLQDPASDTAASGAERCVLLCRYRL